MLLRINHETHYSYSPAVETSQHLAHLKPLTNSLQTLLAHQLSVHPQPDWLSESLDEFGNLRTFFALETAHATLTVHASSLVRTLATPDAMAQAPDSPAWEAVRELLRYRAARPWQAAAQYSFASENVPRHGDLAAYALPSFTPGRPLAQAAQDLMLRIHSDFTYASLSTDVHTPVLQALAQRRGVCQDFAHIMIGCLRSLGLAARYVSGYLLTEPAPGQMRLQGADASHAWVAVWLPGDGGQTAQWYELDPTNARCPGEDYVTLAYGRDFFDVSPMRGVLYGGAKHQLSVAVTVAPA